MEEHPRINKVSPEIYVYATNKNFLNIYDALRIEKVKIEVAGYDQSTGRQTGLASAWLDVDDLRLLAHLVVTRQFKDVLDRGRFEKFGGSDRDGAVESRTLALEWDPGQDGKFARFPYRLTIANGPGLRTANGAVQPKGEPSARLAMRLPEVDLIKIMLAVAAYLQAYEAAHHHRIIAEKVREVQEKLAGRADRQAAAPADDDARAPAAARPTAPALRLIPGEREGVRQIAPPARPSAAPVPVAPLPASSRPPAPGRPGSPVAAATPRPADARPAPTGAPLPRPTRVG
jgi:hypothetical protein